MNFFLSGTAPPDVVAAAAGTFCAAREEEEEGGGAAAAAAARAASSVAEEDQDEDAKTSVRALSSSSSQDQRPPVTPAALLLPEVWEKVTPVAQVHVSGRGKTSEGIMRHFWQASHCAQDKVSSEDMRSEKEREREGLPRECFDESKL